MNLRRQMAARLNRFDKIVVWGAGGLARNALMRWLPAAKIARIVDPTIAKQGLEFCGKTVMNPACLKDDPPDCIVICSTAYLEILEQIDALGVTCPRLYIYELFLPEDGHMSQFAMLQIDLLATKNDPLPLLLLKKPQVLVNITYRLARQLQGKLLLWPFYAVAFVLHYVVCWLTSVQLPLETEIGPGFIIAHPGTTVVTGRAKLGAFVTLYHCSTIGTTLSGASPDIGNFVTIYAGSHVLGGSRLGDHSKVGAMSLMLDLETDGYCTIAGIPATIRKTYTSRLSPTSRLSNT
jgi:serine acetyltransferase